MAGTQGVGATSRGEFERRLKAARKEFARLEALCRDEFEAFGKRQREAKTSIPRNLPQRVSHSGAKKRSFA
jgi:hypothetical protein